jgi:hypothetical protein
MAEKAELITRVPEKMLDEILVSIGDRLSDIASSNNAESGEDDIDQETQQEKWSKDDEPRGVIRTISKTLQQHMDRFWQKKMKLDELTHPGWGDAADLFQHRDQTYCTSEFRFPAVGKPHMDQYVAAPVPTIFGEHV